MQPIVWDDMKHVLALARFGTIAEAARRLGVDEATVTRRLARLEQRLEARLFDRAQGRLVPTEAGQAAAARAERAEQEIDGIPSATFAIFRIFYKSLGNIINLYP